jgi:serine/threonine protein kinase/TolB-like protein
VNNPAAEPEAGRTPNGARTPPDCAAPGPPPEIPDHELLHLIGRGSYGRVWLARNRLGTWRAVKIVSREAFEDRKPFEREFKGIQRFEPVSRSHDGLVDILQVGGTEDYFYYVMELADDASERSDGVMESWSDGKPGSPEPSVHHSQSSSLDVSDTGSLHQSTTPPLHHSSRYAPRTLRVEQQRFGRLPVAECVRIGRLLASALAHLHRHNLVHRDVKPSNIIFVEGQPKLADIGLVADVSEARSFVGTEGFIPPEGPGTPRADLYSLGKVLYEISTGLDRRDFPALPDEFANGPHDDRAPATPTPNSQIADRKSEIDPAPFLELNAVITKACQADPAQRYASAEAMEVDLALLEQGRSVRRKRNREQRWAIARTVAFAASLLLLAGLGFQYLSRRLGTGGPAATSDVASIFVLPFRYSTPPAEPLDETERSLWLAGRITDAFIDGLALIPGVSTGPRKSDWLRFDEDEVRRNVFRTNATRYLLSGRVGKTNDLLQLELRLYARDHNAPLWANMFEGVTNDPIALELRALDPIVKSLGRDLDAGVRQRIERVWERNLEAYRWFLQARRHHWAATRSDSREAFSCFGRALELDPKYVTAQEGYIDVFVEFFDSRPPTEIWETVAERSRRIVELDDTSYVAADRLLDKLIVYDHNWDLAVRTCDRQSRIWPDALISWSVRYRTLGRTNESRLYHERLKTNWPVNAIYRRRTLEHATYGELVWGNYDEAFRLARRCLEEIPDTPSLGQYLLGRCYLATGQYRKAIDAFLESGAIWPSPELDGRIGRAYALLGDRAKALEYLARLQDGERSGHADPYFQAWVHAALGNKDQTLQSLGRAIDYRSELIVFADFGGLRTDRAWDGMRDDPRFEDLCRRVGMGKGQWPK